MFVSWLERGGGVRSEGSARSRKAEDPASGSSKERVLAVCRRNRATPADPEAGERMQEVRMASAHALGQALSQQVLTLVK